MSIQPDVGSAAAVTPAVTATLPSALDAYMHEMDKDCHIFHIATYRVTPAAG